MESAESKVWTGLQTGAGTDRGLVKVFSALSQPTNERTNERAFKSNQRTSSSLNQQRTLLTLSLNNELSDSLTTNQRTLRLSHSTLRMVL